MTLGIPVNPYALNVPNSLLTAAKNLSIKTRIIDLPSLTVTFANKKKPVVHDKNDALIIDSLAPYLLFGFPTAITAFRVISRKCFSQNPVDSVLTADDKAATAEMLRHAGIPQVSTSICPSDFTIVSMTADTIGYPVVLKRTHGAQGRWVRNAVDEETLHVAFEELISEGPGALIMQPQIMESKGVSIRAVITGGELLAVTQRTAKEGEWRSNIANGGTQRPVELTATEREIVLTSAKTLGLQHAGIDLLRTAKGPVVLEVNSCPDFTSMLPYFDDNLAEIVVKASLQQ